MAVAYEKTVRECGEKSAAEFRDPVSDSTNLSDDVSTMETEESPELSQAERERVESPKAVTVLDEVEEQIAELELHDTFEHVDTSSIEENITPYVKSTLVMTETKDVPVAQEAEGIPRVEPTAFEVPDETVKESAEHALSEPSKEIGTHCFDDPDFSSFFWGTLMMAGREFGSAMTEHGAVNDLKTTAAGVLDDPKVNKNNFGWRNPYDDLRTSPFTEDATVEKVRNHPHGKASYS